MKSILNTHLEESLKTGDTKTAIIVAGDSLALIDCSLDLKEIFLKLSDISDVVLACRVSP